MLWLIAEVMVIFRGLTAALNASQFSWMLNPSTIDLDAKFPSRFLAVGVTLPVFGLLPSVISGVDGFALFGLPIVPLVFGGSG